MKVIDDIFNEMELNYILDEYQKALTQSWQINTYHWQDLLTVGTEGLVLMQACSEKVNKMVLESIQEHVQFKENPGIMFYMWTTGSGINWHHDDHAEKACTIYLQDWPIDFGGQLVCKEGRGHKLIPVKKNRLVINDNHTEHMVTKVKKHPHHEVRFTMQVFGT